MIEPGADKKSPDKKKKKGKEKDKLEGLKKELELVGKFYNIFMAGIGFSCLRIDAVWLSGQSWGFEY